MIFYIFSFLHVIYIPCNVIYLLHLRQRERCTSYNVKSRSPVLAVTIWCLFTCLNFFLEINFLSTYVFLSYTGRDCSGRWRSSLAMRSRETREGGPLLTFEIEENGHWGLKEYSTNEGVLPWWVSWACRAGTRDVCSALAAPVGLIQNIFFLIQNIFFLTINFFNSFIPVGRQAGQAAMLGRLFLSMCL
jgi:hypothetical protein